MKIQNAVEEEKKESTKREEALKQEFARLEREKKDAE